MDNVNSDLLLNTFLIVVITFSLWYCWNDFKYTFINTDDTSINNPYGIEVITRSKKTLIYINNWLNCSTDPNGAILRLPDPYTMKQFLYLTHEKGIHLTANDSLIIMHYFSENKIPFEIELFHLVAHQYTSVNGRVVFHQFSDKFGFDNYIYWLTQIYKDVKFDKFSPKFASVMENKKFPIYDSSAPDFNLMYQDYHNNILAEYLKLFKIHRNPIEKIINDTNLPVLNLDKSCFVDPSHYCESCSVDISFGPDEHWAFDILTNKFDHLYTLIRDNQGNLSFKYSSYSDMYDKRLKFIEQIRSFDNNALKHDFLEVKCSKSLNNAFDVSLGYSVKNTHMIKETNYWNFPYDTDYFIKIIKNTPNHHLSQKSLTNHNGRLKFEPNLDFYDKPMQNLHDWISFGEYHRMNIAMTHRYHLWDSYIDPRNDVLINKMKSSFVGDDPIKSEIWDILVNERDESIRLKLWSFLLKDKQNFIDYTLEYKNDYWRLNSEASYPIRERDENSTDQDSYDDRVFIIDDDGPGPGPLIKWEYDPFPDPIDGSLGPTSSACSLLEGTFHFALSTISILYTLFIWFILFYSMYPLLELQYHVYRYRFYNLLLKRI